MHLDLLCVVDALPPLPQLPPCFIPIIYNQYTLDQAVFSWAIAKILKIGIDIKTIHQNN